MIGTITALLISYWFYKSAEAAGKNPLSSAIVGFLSYLIPGVVWTFAITPGLRDAVEHNPGTLSGLFVNYAYILVGVACAVGVKYMHFKQAES
jgi:ABC-type Fe3+ transport system permease subunit